MSSASSNQSVENPDLLEYKELSRLAIVGAIVAAFSLVSLISTNMWAISVIAIAICLFAYYAVRRDPSLTGGSVALVGMALAAATLGYSVSKITIERNHLISTSRTMAEGWLDLVLEKRFLEAHQMTAIFNERQPATASLSAYYTRESTAREGLEGFQTGEAVTAIDEWDGGPLEAEFVSTSGVYKGNNSRQCVQVFRIVESDSKQPIWDIQVTMSRLQPAREEDQTWHWMARNIELLRTYPR